MAFGTRPWCCAASLLVLLAAILLPACSQQGKLRTIDGFIYPAGWPDDRIKVPSGSTPVQTEWIRKLDSTAVNHIVDRKGGPSHFYAVGFQSDLGWEELKADYISMVESAGYTNYGFEQEPTGYLSADETCGVWLVTDSPQGPYTLRMTVYEAYDW